jgi:hypothetical protein
MKVAEVVRSVFYINDSFMYDELILGKLTEHGACTSGLNYIFETTQGVKKRPLF